jgi:hypothetical protein
LASRASLDTETKCSLFAFLHIKAFSYKPYIPTTSDAKRTPRLLSFAHAMDFRETFHEMLAGLVYMWRRMWGEETDSLAHRVAVLENAFGKRRAQVGRKHRREEVKGRNLKVDDVVEVEVDGERQWLGLGDDYGHGHSGECNTSLYSQPAADGYGRFRNGTC